MSYTNLIYFALALLIYVTYAPQGKENAAHVLLSLVAVTVGYYVLTWFAFRSVSTKLREPSPSLARTLSIISSLEGKFIVLALFLHLFLIYGAGFKEVLWRAAILEQSSLLDLVAGLSPFVVLLMVLWINAYQVVQTSFEATMSRSSFLWSQLKMNGSMLLPVLLFSLFIDIVTVLTGPKWEASYLTELSESLLFIPFLAVLIIIYPLVLRYSWGCHPLPHGERRNVIESFCRKAGLKVTNIFIWPAFHGKSLTAGIAGVTEKLRYLFVTPGLLDLLTDPELESVVAHEAGHIRKRHVYYYVIVFLLLPFSLTLFYNLVELFIYGFDDLIAIPAAVEQSDPALFSLGMLALVGSLVFLYLRVFFGFLSRNFEREADLFVFDVVGHPFNLISSLEKISYFGGHGRDTPSWHHYGIGERVRYLEKCFRDKSTIQNHERKVRIVKTAGIFLFIAATILVGILNVPYTSEMVEGALLEGKIERVLKNRLDEPDVLVGVGSELQEQGRYRQAETFYRRALEIQPDHAVALNNLAWLYATTPDTHLRDTGKALALARKAAEIEKEPFILDTLAEAYWVNGMRESALSAIDAALALEPDNRAYYEKQRKKFAEEVPKSEPGTQ